MLPRATACATKAGAWPFTAGQPDVLVTVTGIYTNLLPENDAVRIKRGVTVYSERELDLLLEDLGG